MKEIPLTRGKVAIVDDADYERVSAYKWHAYYKRGWYARNMSKGQLHRFLMNAPEGVLVDHKNGNGLDCRRKNMRLATNAQNQYNSKKAKHNTSGFRGVHASRGQWAARIQIEGKQTWLGRYSTPEEAARAYDAKVRETRGDFGRTNF